MAQSQCPCMSRARPQSVSRARAPSMTRVKDECGPRIRAQYLVGTQRRPIWVFDCHLVPLHPPLPPLRSLGKGASPRCPGVYLLPRQQSLALAVAAQGALPLGPISLSLSVGSWRIQLDAGDGRSRTWSHGYRNKSTAWGTPRTPSSQTCR